MSEEPKKDAIKVRGAAAHKIKVRIITNYHRDKEMGLRVYRDDVHELPRAVAERYVKQGIAEKL